MSPRLSPLVLVALIGSASHAHLMAAGRGTLNVVGDSAFLVLSIPAAALSMADVDGDGRLSNGELSAHHAEVLRAIEQQVTLRDDVSVRTLDGLILSLDAPEDAPAEAGRHLVALGRFPVGTPAGALRLHVGLFGPAAEPESVLVTRGEQKQVLEFSPSRVEQALFPSKWVALRHSLAPAFGHGPIGVGAVLFLLVALAAGTGLRRVARA
jgi:hypothetical protein